MRQSCRYNLSLNFAFEYCIKAIREAEKRSISWRVEPTIISRVVDLSGGHPPLLQLLGSHLIAREEADPDGLINPQDLVSALRKICYEDRARRT